MKKLLNSKEAVADQKLTQICEDWDARVFPKVRVADVLPISRSGISRDHFRFALQSHFDFVVTNSDSLPLFAVEYDGPSHSKAVQKKRDRRKDHLCNKFGFPILRINCNHLRRFRRYDLLTWLVEVWFLGRSFEEAQDKGDIPWEEGFDPLMLMSLDEDEVRFPYWLALDVQLKLDQLQKEGVIASEVPNLLIGYDRRSNVRSIASLEVAAGRFIIAKTAARKQLFTVPLSGLVEQMVLFEIGAEVERFLGERAILLSLEEMTAKFHAFANSNAIGRASGVADLIQGLPPKQSCL